MELQKRSDFPLSESNHQHIDGLFRELCNRHELVSGQSVLFVETQKDTFHVTLNAKCALIKNAPATSVTVHGGQFNLIVSDAFKKITDKIANEKSRRSKRGKRLSHATISEN